MSPDVVTNQTGSQTFLILWPFEQLAHIALLQTPRDFIQLASYLSLTILTSGKKSYQKHESSLVGVGVAARRMLIIRCEKSNCTLHDPTGLKPHVTH